MGSEELQRTMEFLAQQQAQAWSSIQSLQAIVREHSAQIERLAGHVREIADLLLRTVRLVEELDRNTGGRFLEPDERFRRTDERFPQLEERFRETDERLRQTDGRVNALIALAERCFQSGKQQLRHPSPGRRAFQGREAQARLAKRGYVFVRVMPERDELFVILDGPSPLAHALEKLRQPKVSQNPRRLQFVAQFRLCEEIPVRGGGALHIAARQFDVGQGFPRRFLVQGTRLLGVFERLARPLARERNFGPQEV